MAYIPSLNKLQIGVEVAYGDEGTDTIEPVGVTEVTMNPKVETFRVPDKRGDTMPAWLNFVKRRWCEGMIKGYVDYERFNIFLDSMFGLDASSPHTYISQLDWSGAAESSLSLRYGQTGALYLVGGVLPKSLVISGESNGPIMYTYNYFGTDVSDGATHAAVAVDTPDWCMGHHGTIAIDEGATATMGTTPLVDTSFSFEANITSNKAPVWHMGDQKPNSYRNGKWGGSMKVVLEGTAVVLAHFGDILDATATQKVYNIRMTFTDTANTLEIDFCGTCEDPPNIITDQDGVVTVELSLVPSYNSTYLGCWGADLIIA